MLFIILTLIAAALLGVGQAAPSTTVNLARDDKNPNLTQIICKPQMYREARKDFTQQNADYLRKITNGGVGAYLGAFTNGNNCQRMACEYASGLYVCNDNLFAINVPWTTLADYAEAVMNDPREECNYHIDHYEGGTKGQDVVWGQAFDANGWNIVVGMWHSDDKCP